MTSSIITNPSSSSGGGSSSGAIVAPPLLPTLLGSLGRRWARNPQLSALIPPQRVITGLIPNLSRELMPYASITQPAGHKDTRTNVTQYDTAPVVFHVWVGEADSGLGELLEIAIRDAYANRRWRYYGGRVIDVLSMGPAQKNQIQQPDYKYWEIVLVFALKLVWRRVDRRPIGSGSASGSCGSSSSTTSGSGGVSGSPSTSN